MLQAFLNFWKAKIPPDTGKELRVETVSVPTATVPVQRDAIANPLSTAPWRDELFQNRARDPEWGIAVAAKVSSWLLLAQMGSSHLIPADYRAHMVKAASSNDFEMQSMLFCLIQTNLMQNYGTVSEVRSL